MLQPGTKARSHDALDTDVTDGETRIVMNFETFGPGCQSRGVFSKKTSHNQKDVERMG